MLLGDARNKDIHRDLKMETVDKVIQKFAQSHEATLHNVNTEAIQCWTIVNN